MGQNEQHSRKHFTLFLVVFLAAQFVAFIIGTTVALQLGVVPVRAFGIGAVCWGITAIVGVVLLLRGNS